MVLYLIAAIYQLFQFCWYGQRLQNEVRAFLTIGSEIRSMFGQNGNSMLQLLNPAFETFPHHYYTVCCLIYSHRPGYGAAPLGVRRTVGALCATVQEHAARPAAVQPAADRDARVELFRHVAGNVFHRKCYSGGDTPPSRSPFRSSPYCSAYRRFQTDNPKCCILLYRTADAGRGIDRSDEPSHCVWRAPSNVAIFSLFLWHVNTHSYTHRVQILAVFERSRPTVQSTAWTAGGETTRLARKAR